MSTFIDRIKAGVQAFLRGPAKGELQTSRTASLGQEQITGMLGSLTPKKLQTILENADNGDIVDQHRLFADVEDADEHIFTELSKRRRALLSLDWSILPAVTADKGQAKKAEAIAEAVRAQFDAIPGFEDMILGLGDGIGHGFSPLEIEWGYDGKVHLPIALHHRPQHTFFLTPLERELRLRTQDPEGLPLEPLGWIIHRHKSKNGWFARYGLFRVLMASFLLKQYARRGFAEFLEIHGLPLRVGKFPSWAEAEEKNTLLAGLRNLGRDAAAIIPEEMQVEFVEAVKASERPFTAMMDHCERGQSKAILGGTLTTQADGRTSTNALGKIHNEVRHDILVSDAVQIAATLSQQLLTPLAVLNCGLEDPKLAPWFRFDTAEPADLLLLADALPKLAPVMRIPARWAYEKCRIPEPEGDEPVLTPPTRPETQAEPPAQTRAAHPAVALRAQDAETDPEQAALDVAALALESTMQGQVETLLAPLFAEVQAGLPPDQLMARLASLYPRLDASALEEQLARVLFVSALWGRVTSGAEEGAHGD